MRKVRATKKHLEARGDGEMAPRIDHDPLKPGDVVMLPDGAVAAIDRIVGTDAYVIEWHKTLGRGPWIFPLGELVPVA